MTPEQAAGRRRRASDEPAAEDRPLQPAIGLLHHAAGAASRSAPRSIRERYDVRDHRRPAGGGSRGGRRSPRSTAPSASASRVLTGAPIRDALRRQPRASRRDAPSCRWSGAAGTRRSSPTETLDEPAVDVTVQAQGEATFSRDRRARWPADEHLDGVRGIAYRRRRRGRRRTHRGRWCRWTRCRPTTTGCSVERYFALKGQRQLDYISSHRLLLSLRLLRRPVRLRPRLGRRSRRSGWARRSRRSGDRYRFTELAFQDETFFTYAERVAEIAERVPAPRSRASTGRPPCAPIRAPACGDEAFALCVPLGAAAGDDRRRVGLPGDARLDAEGHHGRAGARHAPRCASATASARIFPFIVGFPGESDDSVEETLGADQAAALDEPALRDAALLLQALSRLADHRRGGARRATSCPRPSRSGPSSTSSARPAPWVSREKHRLIERFKFYNRFAGGPRELAAPAAAAPLPAGAAGAMSTATAVPREAYRRPAPESIVGRRTDLHVASTARSS